MTNFDSFPVVHPDLKKWTKDQLIDELNRVTADRNERVLKQVEHLEKITALQTRVEKLRLGYYRVKEERDEARKIIEDDHRLIDNLRDAENALQGQVNQLTAINDNLQEQLSHYKALVGLNEPGF